MEMKLAQSPMEKLMNAFKQILFEKHSEVTCAKVRGSDRSLNIGVGWTADQPGTCNPGWFVGDMTTILGAENPQRSSTSADWQVLVDPDLIEKYETCRLIICCERPHGGLHTRLEGAQAHVSINGFNRDLIALKDQPDGHTDFFHRPPNPPEIPCAWPMSGCATVYSWPVDKRHLSQSGNQVVEVELDPGVSWDIDYVCLVISHVSCQLREACKQVAYIIIGVVLGAIATVLLGG